mmetsp:Transcript_99169/g.289397  ORF Transcript_99169/g.289397 Transcript_99169/m.289397 type:complete len:250 (+) Transcript_99169:227-976(+)
MLQVCNEVVDVLDADGQAQKVRGQGPLLRGDGGVAHGAGHLAQTVHAPEGYSCLENPAGVEQAPGEVQRARCEADDAAGSCALRTMDPQTLRIASVGSRVEHILDLRMLGQECRDLLRALLGLLHAQEHGLDASQEEETFERGQGSSLGILQESHSVSKLWIPDADQPAGAVCMAREELGRGVDDNVDPQSQWLANDWRHHCAVNAEQQVVLVRKVRQCTQVRYPHQRVRGALRVDELGPWADLRADCI